MLVGARSRTTRTLCEKTRCLGPHMRADAPDWSWRANRRSPGSRTRPPLVLAIGWPRLSSNTATAAKQAHLFFEPLNPFGQPVEALVDPLPVSLFVPGASTSPLASRVRASLVPASGSASPGAPPRAASVAPVSPAAHGFTSRSVFVRLEEGLFTQ
jgi:hypothetical protein